MLHKKGFTLIELIIVIALIALLATTVILVINPVKIFQEARDSQRIADLGQMNSAMSLMLATSSTQPTMGSGTTKCYQLLTTYDCKTRYANTSGITAFATPTVAGSQKVDGTGWVPVALGSSPAIAAWPKDPSDATASNTTLFYSYAYDSSNAWEFSAKMESARYKAIGTDDVEKTDGGNVDTLFEVGTNVLL